MSVLSPFPWRVTTPELVVHHLYLQGGGAGNPTVLYGGEGMAITRVGTGEFQVVWSDAPGIYAGLVGMDSASPDTARITSAYNSATRSLQFSVKDTLSDLATNQHATVLFFFKQSDLKG